MCYFSRQQYLPRIFLGVLFCLIITGCEEKKASQPNNTDVATSCVEADFVAQCPVGTTPEFSTVAANECNERSEEQFTDGSGSVTASCESVGECSVLCIFSKPCKCGVDRITPEGVFCIAPCEEDNPVAMGGVSRERALTPARLTVVHGVCPERVAAMARLERSVRATESMKRSIVLLRRSV